MRTLAKVGLTALIAAVLLSAVLSTASAGKLEFSSQRFRVAWSRLEFQSVLVTDACQVTLEGSFHSSTIPKRERLLIGAVTRIDIKKESCTNGEALVIRSSLPWHITYESFNGSLPNITAVRLLLSRFLFWIDALGERCTYGKGTDNITLSANVTAGEITTLMPLVERNVTNLLEGRTSFPECPANVHLIGGVTDGIITVLNSTTRIRLRLI